MFGKLCLQSKHSLALDFQLSQLSIEFENGSMLPLSSFIPPVFHRALNWVAKEGGKKPELNPFADLNQSWATRVALRLISERTTQGGRPYLLKMLLKSFLVSAT